MSAICKTIECGRLVFAAQFCKRCYNKAWRANQPGALDRSESDRRLMIRQHGVATQGNKRASLESELKRVTKVYEVACGFETRLKWRREITRLEAELRDVEHERSAV